MVIETEQVEYRYGYEFKAGKGRLDAGYGRIIGMRIFT